MKTIEHKFLVVGLLLGLVNGLIFVYLVPPWQHYDEPNHFEYAWLVANRGRLPKIGDYDLAMRAEVAASMVANGFFKGMSFTPDVAQNDEPAWIGTYSQLANPPVYYLMVAIPLRVMSNFGVDDQLYAARLVSLLFFLCSIAAAYGVACELTPQGHRLRLYLPAGMALLPGLADIMTSVNNDAGAVACFSLFVWGSVRLLRRGFSLPVFLALLAIIGLGLGTKETTYVAIPLFGLVAIFSLLRERLRIFAWVICCAVGLIAVAAVFDWGDAAVWVRKSYQKDDTRSALASSVLGDHALRVEVGTDPTDEYKIYQLLPLAGAKQLTGKNISLGAWIWAERPVTARSPILHLYELGQDLYREITLSSEPAFFVFTETIGVPADRSWIILAPMIAAEPAPVAIYYDGLVLTEGDYGLSSPPRFEDDSGTSGVWDGETFVNLIRNPSAETAGPRVRAWADRLGALILPDRTRPSWIVGILQDVPGAGWFHRMLSEHLFRTFWGLFGWGHVPLIGDKPYRILAAAVGLALVGFISAAVKNRNRLLSDEALFLGIALFAVWGVTFVRSENYVLLPVFFPVARYAYPAIIPTLLLLLVGWNELFSYLKHRVRLPELAKNVIYLVLLSLVNLWGLVSIWVFYHG